MTDTRGSLAKELAEERMANDIAFAQEGGCKYDDIKIEQYMEEALQFVNRCILVGMETY